MAKSPLGLILLVNSACAQVVGLDEIFVDGGGPVDTGGAESSCEASTVVGTCPSGMVAVPGGCFYDRVASREVSVASFCMDVNEVTLGEYSSCVLAGGCPPVENTVTRLPGDSDTIWAEYNSLCNARLHLVDHPINCVSGLAAEAFCAKQGRRLPTQDEWDWAAHGGPENAVNPWGNGPVADRPCWTGVATAVREGTCARGASKDVSVQGVRDLAGNVAEWTNTGLGADLRVLCGGTYGSRDPFELTTCQGLPTDRRNNRVGFRCVK